MKPAFSNCEVYDFSDAALRKEMEQAIAAVGSSIDGLAARLDAFTTEDLEQGLGDLKGDIDTMRESVASVSSQATNSSPGCQSAIPNLASSSASLGSRATLTRGASSRAFCLAKSLSGCRGTSV